ncbi:MAG TPA: nucleotidyl transferase AbiEii/AbiGii toxin family protein [Ramlibacter sp.]|jgi:hypothetical protein|nr:nucleotidyl transferase AbiEii/AbiGii toxin family protein [Ramlibacter sp.]
MSHDNRFTPCMHILPQAQTALWPLLRPIAGLGFVLYGGTAIALRLGHRQSVDFDFFIEEPLDKTVLLDALPLAADATVLQDRPNTWTLLLRPIPGQDDYVKISFFGTIGFGRYGQPQWTDDGVLKVASLDDLMATKVKVLLQRIEAKDYRDIAAMLRAGVSLERGLSVARQMFGSNFQPSESLKAMTWFEGGDLSSLTDEERNTLVDHSTRVGSLPIVEKIQDVLQ